MMGRIKQDLWGVSLFAMVGFLPLLQGPGEAAPGTIFVAKAAALRARMIDFEFNTTQGYAIEATENLFRFYTNDVRIEDPPGTPVEVTTPWTMDQVDGLNWLSIGDMTYFFHSEVSPYVLSRTGATSFSLDALAMRSGPWLGRNSDEASGVVASGTTGSVTLTAADPIFAAGDVGGLFEIEFGDLASIPMWEPGISASIGEILQWDGRVYQVTSGSRTGTVAPEHTEGTEYDGKASGTDINSKGPYGVQLLYLYDRYGQLLITGFTNSTMVTAMVQRRLASSGTAQWRWKFGAFSPRRGWPSYGCLWDNRLVVAGVSTPHASVKGDFAGSVNFATRADNGDVTRDMAFSEPLPDPNPIRWMIGKDDLQIGTSSAEYYLRQSSAATGIGPGNVYPARETDEGSAAARPLRADGRTLFISAGRDRVMQFARSDLREGYDAIDLNRYADHIGNDGIAEIAWLKTPRKLVVARTDAGGLKFSIYVPSEQALGWAHRPLADGLRCSSMTVITDPEGKYRQLWLTAEVAGEAWVLRMAPIRKTGDDSLKQVMSDAAWIHDGAATTAIAAPHLAGRTVEIVADGRIHEPIVLDGAGNGTLSFAANHIIAGLTYPAYMTSLSMEAGGDNGAAQMKAKRISKLGVRVLAADGLTLSVQGGAPRAMEQQKGNSPMDKAFPLQTRDWLVESIGKYEDMGQITIARVQPKPATILGFLAETGVGAG